MKIRLLVLVSVFMVYACGKEPGLTEIQQTRPGTYSVRSGKWEGVRFDVPAVKSGAKPEVTVTNAGEGWSRVRFIWQIPEAVQQDELTVAFRLPGGPDFWWAPHLAPDDGDFIAQHSRCS